MNDLLEHLHQLHTTKLGKERIKKNLAMDAENVVDWCKIEIFNQRSKIERRGKNWYVTTDHCQITVNVSSYTIITAHKTEK